MRETTLEGLVADLVAVRHAGGYRFKVQERVLRQFAEHCRREGYPDGSITKEDVLCQPPSANSFPGGGRWLAREEGASPRPRPAPGGATRSGESGERQTCGLCKCAASVSRANLLRPAALRVMWRYRIAERVRAVKSRRLRGSLRSALTGRS
jgi:hypothetical protein